MNNRIFCLKRAWIVLFGFCLLTAVGQVQGQFTYTVNNGTITITGTHVYTGPDASVIIPDEINNLPVTAIGDGAFYNFNEKSVIIPDSVTSIGGDAFSGCTSLISVTIPDSITSIGDQAFYGCSSLASVTIPDSITTIGFNTFSDCSSLTNVTIPNTITTIVDGAFGGCSSLTGITIPDSVTSIGQGAFGDCYALTNVAISSFVTNIGQAAFSQCYSVMAYTVDPSNTAYSSVDGVLFDKLQTVLIQYPGGVAGSYTMPNTVTSIGYTAFADNLELSSATVPISVTNIGHYSFNMCFKLNSVYFEGNAPATNGATFGSDPVTIYYLPGTTGWSTNYAGRPTAPWPLPNPTVLNGSTGLQSNQFGFTVSWATNRSVVVEACTDMTNPDWEPVQTNTLTATPDGGWFPFSDPQWTNYPSRFYRIAAQ